jgi:undecaprenyl diphosphate synthase
MADNDPQLSCAPRHVALIMDGNGRWAHQRSLPRSAGHKQGVEAVRRAVRAGLDLGIEYLTIFSFSAENWSRPSSEVNYLLGLLRRFVRQDVAELHRAGVRVRIIGDRENLQPDIVRLLEECENLTSSNSAMTLVVAFNYGGRDEVAAATRSIAREAVAGRIAVEDIDAAMVSDHLYAPDIPEPDLLIRTSGEQRISNFLLWQLAYTEFVFVPEHWPDFSREILERAIQEYSGRDRRFGGLKVQAS